MTDEYTLVGELSLGACVPVAVSATATADASIGLVLPNISAELAGLLELQGVLSVSPPSISAQLEAAMAVVANLQLDMPTISLDLSLMAEVIAELQATLGSLQAQLSAIVALNLTLGTPGVYAYTYSGSSGGLIPGGLPGVSTSTPCNAVVFAATDAGAWAAMQTAFATGGG